MPQARPGSRAGEREGEKETEKGKAEPDYLYLFGERAQCAVVESFSNRDVALLARWSRFVLRAGAWRPAVGRARVLSRLAEPLW